MYSFIWRRLPFGLPGKLTGSLLLAAGAVALLWFVIFPWAEPLLPFDDVQVTQDTGGPGGGNPGGGNPGDAPGDAPGLGEHDLPYDTSGDNPAPTRSR